MPRETKRNRILPESALSTGFYGALWDRGESEGGAEGQNRTGDTMIFSPIRAAPAASVKVRIGRFAKEIADLGFR